MFKICLLLIVSIYLVKSAPLNRVELEKLPDVDAEKKHNDMNENQTDSAIDDEKTERKGLPKAPESSEQDNQNESKQDDTIENQVESTPVDSENKNNDEKKELPMAPESNEQDNQNEVSYEVSNEGLNDETNAISAEN